MSRRLSLVAFGALAVATIVAFFLIQSLKVTTPLIAGLPKPHPSRINPVAGGICDTRTHDGVRPTDFRRMTISFLLLNRADDVDVAIVNAAGTVVDTIAHARPMAINRRAAFTWNGHQADGAVAAPGDYYVQVRLIHQHRTVRIADASTGAAEPVQVETTPAPIHITGVRADGVEPALIPQASGRPVAIHFTVIGTRRPTVRVYRTDLPGRPRLVNAFRASSQRTAFWNGRLSNGRLAPQGTYLTAVTAIDRACTPSSDPTRIPPVAGSARHAGVTVRYLAAEPPVTALAPGSTATVEVDSRRHVYRWTLTRAGSTQALRSGRSSAVALRVRLPAGADALYVLSLRWGAHRTAVPLVAGLAGPARGPGRGPAVGSRRVLVVLPALTWQGLNPVDDDGDGIPNTLAAGTPISLERPYTNGLPQGFAAEAGLLAFLRAHGLRVTLATDVSLVRGGATLLRGDSGVILAGSETWLPASTGAALSTWVGEGGHVLSLGIGALRRSVTVSGDQALDPTQPQSVDMLSGRPLGVRPTGGSLLLVDRNGQGLFSSRAQALSGFGTYEGWGPVQSPGRLLTSAGVSAGSPAVIGYALGRGSVVDIGLPGFGSSLARNVTAQSLLTRAYRLLAR